MANTPTPGSGIQNWTVEKLPDLTGKTYLITGGNTGLGFEAARYLGNAGGNVILACRSLAKAETAKSELQHQVKGQVDVLGLDLGDLSSIRQASQEIHQRYDQLDALINNAGVMQTPPQETADGFEMQVGTNHLGHFLLTGLLLDLVEAAGGRVVTLTSLAHKLSPLDLEDYMSKKKYSPTEAYSKSKLSNLIFSFELERRLKAAGSKASSIACHPGYSNTKLQSSGPKGFLNLVYKLTNPLLAQPADQGAIPTVLAAAGKEAKPGAFYGPTKMGESRGPVGDAAIAPHALDKDMWTRLWKKSEELVDFEWNIPAIPSA